VIVPHRRRRSVYADRLLEFPDLVFSDGREFQHRGRWRELLGCAGRLILEIGCNDASLLAEVAAKYPSIAFIGIDWKCRALYDAATRTSAARLRNVALLHGRAQDIRRIFADGEVDEIWVFHPDPCDKPRELPNRLLAESFLLDAHAVLRDRLILKTDHREYFDWFRNELTRPAVAARFKIEVASEDYWNDPPAREQTSTRFCASELTFFERRFMKKRKPIHYIELAKAQANTAAAHSPNP
jgi:tRNA (guanine-N7-)-methyltransferase